MTVEKIENDGQFIDFNAIFMPSPANCKVRKVYNIVKEYPNMFHVYAFKHPRFYVTSSNSSAAKKSSLNSFNPSSSPYFPTVTSVNRTKTTVRDIVLCNDFQIFATFTFNKNKVNRFSYPECQRYMNCWLHRQKTKDPKFSYLIIPEFHKNGAIHFHALLGHFQGSLHNSKCFDSAGRRIYNITCWRAGFTTAVFIDNKEAVASYILKYITKQFVAAFNKRRFYCSRNLIRPIKSVNSNIFNLTLPLFRSNKVSDYGDVETFVIDKF